MIITAYVIASLVAIGIVFIGTRFFWGPAAASGEFGIPGSPPPSTAFNAWLAVKGTRDIVSGLFIVLLMVDGSARLLGEFMLVASLIAFSDAATVLRSGGSRKLAFGMHALTGLVIAAAGVMLIAGASYRM